MLYKIYNLYLHDYKKVFYPRLMLLLVIELNFYLDLMLSPPFSIFCFPFSLNFKLLGCLNSIFKNLPIILFLMLFQFLLSSSSSSCLPPLFLIIFFHFSSLFFVFEIFHLFYVYYCFAPFIYVHHVSGMSGVGSPLNLKLVTDGCQLSCGYWEISPGSLQEQ